METHNREVLFRPPVILSIAGSDSFAGAGIQADIKTAGALGAYCCTAITAITAQNSKAVSSIWPVPRQELQNQLVAVNDDVALKAVKIGMLGSVEAVETVSHFLLSRGPVPVVLDPVIRSSAGDDLATNEIIAAMREMLFSHATAITPNIDEAAAILDTKTASSTDEMREQALALQKLGANAVLVKGGHLLQETAMVSDVLVDDGQIQIFEARRITTQHSHGTGCSLSTAIAVELAKGEPLADAVRIAKGYVTNAIAYAARQDIVDSNGPINHFYHHKYKVRV